MFPWCAVHRGHLCDVRRRVRVVVRETIVNFSGVTLGWIDVRSGSRNNVPRSSPGVLEYVREERAHVTD